MSESGPGDRYQRYLLGELPEDERDRLEDEYFSTAEGYQELRAAEDDLLDAYVGGGLTPEQKGRFEAGYLGTEEGRQRLERARLLQHAVAEARRWRQAVEGRSPRWVWPAATAAAVAIMALGAALLVHLVQLRGELEQARSRQEAMERTAAGQESRLAVLQQQLERLRAEAGRAADPGALVQRVGRVVDLVLRPGLQRDLDPVPRLALSPPASTVRLILRLRADPGQACRVSVQTADGRELWSRRGLRAVSQGGPALVVELPAAALAAGQHVVIVSSDRRPEEALAEYVFQVAAR